MLWRVSSHNLQNSLSQYSCYSTMLNLGYIWRLITTGVGMKLDGPGADKKKKRTTGVQLDEFSDFFVRDSLSL